MTLSRIVAFVLLFIALFFLTIGIGVGRATAQTVDASLSFTAQGQGYWVVLVDGEQVSQHQAEREAYESATNQWLIHDGGAEVQVIHNAVIDVDGFVDVEGVDPQIVEVPVEVIVEVPGPERIVEVEVIREVVVEVPVEVIREVEVIVEVPVDTGGNPVGIPGADVWQGIPPTLITRQFRVLEDDWAVASDNNWLYAYRVSPDNNEGWLVHRPARYWRNQYWQAESTELTDDQIVELITALYVEN